MQVKRSGDMRYLILFLVGLFLTILACSKKDLSGGGATPTPPSPPAPVPPPVIDPATVSVPMSSVQVIGTFNFRKLKDVHPRLLFSAAEISGLVTSVQADVFAKPTYDDVISRADALLGTALLNYGLDGANLRIQTIHIVSNDHIPYLVLAYQFTKNTAYAKRAWDQLNLMCSWDDWGANRHFLDAGIAAKAVAIAYDGLYDYLTSAQRTVLYNAVRNFVLVPGKNQIDNGTGPFKWYDTNDNWNGICHGGMIMAALATYEMDSSFNSQVVATCANGMLKYIQSFDPDGASEEGLSYWSYGLQNTFLALESLNRVLGGTFGLTNPSGFRKTGMFPYSVSGPVGTATFGDDYVYAGKANRFLSYFWFSKFYKDATMARAHYEACMAINETKPRKMNGWFDLLFYDKQLVSQGSLQAQPLSSYVKGVDYAQLLEVAGDDHALYIGMHGGDNQASHGHLDAGSFFLQGEGENWAQGNLGVSTPYPSDYFNVTGPAYTAAPNALANTPGRFYYYRVRAESKNCLVFNPDSRPDQNPSGVATLIKDGNNSTGGYYVLNLKDNYNRDVTEYKRGIKLNRSKQLATIQDEFIPNKTSTIYWIMHTAAIDGVAISQDGKTATMSRNGKTLYARIVAPEDARFDKVARSNSIINYLNETMPVFSSIMQGKNPTNPYYGKLQIRLGDIPASKVGTIRVDFSRVPLEGMTITPLDNWTTDN
jgi:hypothetical protein